MLQNQIIDYRLQITDCTTMALSEDTVSILKACHPVLLANREAIGSTFYKLLFKDHPELQNMFNLSHLQTDKDGKPGPQVIRIVCYDSLTSSSDAVPV